MCGLKKKVIFRVRLYLIPPCDLFFFQLTIKQELKLPEPTVLMKKDKKTAKEMIMCPKKKKRKQRSPAKVQVSSLLLFWTCGKMNDNSCLIFLTVNKILIIKIHFRFLALTTTDQWEYRTPSVTSVFIVTLPSEPTIICRGMSSFTLVGMDRFDQLLASKYKESLIKEKTYL